MKKTAAIIASIILASSSAISVFAEDTASSTAVPDTTSMQQQQQNIQEQMSNETQDNTDASQQNANQQTQNTQNQTENQNNTNSSSTSVNFNNELFAQEANAFLQSNGFSFDSFNAQKFDLPDTSTFTTAADLQKQYTSMLGDLSKAGYGTKKTMTINEGYTKSIKSAYKDTFGNGLMSDFKQYKLTGNPNDIFKKAEQTRNSLFSSVKQSSQYKAVEQNMDINSILSKVDNNIDTIKASTSLPDTSSLEATAKATVENTHTSLYYSNKKKENETQSAFNEKQKANKDFESNTKEAVEYWDKNFGKIIQESSIDKSDANNHQLPFGENLTLKYSKILEDSKSLSTEEKKEKEVNLFQQDNPEQYERDKNYSQYSTDTIAKLPAQDAQQVIKSKNALSPSDGGNQNQKITDVEKDSNELEEKKEDLEKATKEKKEAEENLAKFKKIHSSTVERTDYKDVVDTTTLSGWLNDIVYTCSHPITCLCGDFGELAGLDKEYKQKKDYVEALEEREKRLTEEVSKLQTKVGKGND